jgi:photosystem II stability/assembly factor-like uncharacterized protein
LIQAIARWLLLLAVVPAAAFGQYTLYASMSITKEYVVGAKLPPSGLFIRGLDGSWEHAGYNHPFIFSLDYDPKDPETIYLAAGNGLFGASDGGRKWRLLTGSDITELRDVAVDRNRPGTIYFGYSHGIRVSHDRGNTWTEIGSGLHRKYTEAIRVDNSHAGVLLAGGEEGIFRSGDGGETWTIAGAGGFQITRIEQSAHDTCYWLATTQTGGLFTSRDCGKSFETSGRLGVGSNLTDISFDPFEAKRVAVGGWDAGVNISEDGGQTWNSRNIGLPSSHVTSIAFDPTKSGRIYASVNEEGLYVSDDIGKTWSKDGLDGSMVTRMKFVRGLRSK